MNILVASSNLFRRELSSFLLSEAGHIVHEVKDSAALFQHLTRMRPHLILLDARLKGLETDEAANQIKHYAQHTPIMVLTNNSSLLGSVANLVTSGSMQLSWPYDADDLINRVQALSGQMSQTARPSTSPLSSIYSA